MAYKAFEREAVRRLLILDVVSPLAVVTVKFTLEKMLLLETSVCLTTDGIPYYKLGLL